MLVSTEWSAGNEKAMCIKIEHVYKYLIHKNIYTHTQKFNQRK